jgi:hypothetical protein
MKSFYAATSTYINGKHKTLRLSRYLVGLRHGDKRICDHRNHDTLDDRMSNLRICTKAQNGQNRRKNCNNTSGFKGVKYYKRGKKWVAAINFENKRYHLGYFNFKEEAATAYDNASKKMHGEFALTNNIGRG